MTSALRDRRVEACHRNVGAAFAPRNRQGPEQSSLSASRLSQLPRSEAVARFTRVILTTQPSERFLQDFGGIRPSSANGPGSCPYAMARRWFRTFKRLWTEHMRRHSLSAACIPRPEKRRHRRLALMLPKTGSVVTLRLA